MLADGQAVAQLCRGKCQITPTPFYFPSYFVHFIFEIVKSLKITLDIVSCHKGGAPIPLVCIGGGTTPEPNLRKKKTHKS